MELYTYIYIYSMQNPITYSTLELQQNTRHQGEKSVKSKKRSAFNEDSSLGSFVWSLASTSSCKCVTWEGRSLHVWFRSPIPVLKGLCTTLVGTYAQFYRKRAGFNLETSPPGRSSPASLSHDFSLKHCSTLTTATASDNWWDWTQYTATQWIGEETTCSCMFITQF